MGSENLTSEQKAFLEECNLEFSERFTSADIKFKQIFDSEIPPPPIVCPWHGKNRFNNMDRDRPGGSYNNFRNRGGGRDNENDYRGYRDGGRDNENNYRGYKRGHYRP